MYLFCHKIKEHNTVLRSPSQSELTPILYDMELTQLSSETSIFYVSLKMYTENFESFIA